MKKYLSSILFGLFLLPITASPIVGAWVHNNGAEGDSDTLVFLSNGAYFHAEDSDVDTMQRGTFTWDEETSQLSLTPLTSTDGSELPQTFNFPIVGDEAMGGEFQRVVSASNPLVGGWHFGDAATVDSGAMVFLENGVYFFMQDSEPDPGFFQAGMERGTYAYDATSGDFSVVITTDTNGEIGLSHPEGPQKLALLGDDLIYKPGFLSFGLSRVAVSSDTASVLNQQQNLMAADDGMFGVMVETVSGFFYTVERSGDLSSSDAMTVLEGDGSMSAMLLETDPAAMPKAFFTTRVEIQQAIASVDIADFLNGQSVDGVTFQADGTWEKGGDSGLWTYEVPDAGSGVVTLTSNANGNDPAQSRTEYDFDFSDLGSFDEVPAEVRSYAGAVETEMRSLSANLDPSPAEPDLAPTVEEFTALVAGKTIKGVNFEANQRWSAFGEGGNWTYSVSSPTTAKLVVTFDLDSNDPLIARDDYLMTFTEEGGTSQVSTRIELSDNNELDEVQNTVLNLTRNTFAPTVGSYAIIIDGRNINGTVFDEEGTFVFNNSESGRWTAVAVGDDQILMTQTYNDYDNNPLVYREESLLTFDGSTQVTLNYKEFDGNVLDFEVNGSVDLD